jgi:hypothetical protein
MKTPPKVHVRDRRLALWGGVALLTVGSLLLHDAFEGRGKSRPWLTKFLPGA